MADQQSNIVGWIVAGGGGTILGSVVVSVISVLGSKGKDRASAADVSVNAATKIMDRLEKENTSMREALVIITEILDELLVGIDLPPKTVEQLKVANRNAKLSVR